MDEYHANRSVPPSRLDQWERDAAFVVPLQAKAYRLLIWTREAVDKGWVAPEAVHKSIQLPDVVEAWLLEQGRHIPLDACPDCTNPVERKAFVHLFSAFLQTSFDVNPSPGEHLYSPDAHCFCPVCSWMVPTTHLKPKKPTRHDKRKAVRLKADTLRRFVQDAGAAIDGEGFESLLGDPDLAGDIAVVAYVNELVARSKGCIAGAAALVLWRDFAWEKTGCPKKSFLFSMEYVREARDRLLARIRPDNSERGREICTD